MRNYFITALALPLTLFFISLCIAEPSGTPADSASPASDAQPAPLAAGSVLPFGNFSTTAPAASAPEKLSPEGLLFKAQDSLEAGDYQGAVELYQEALPSLPDDSAKAKAHYGLAYSYSAFSREDDAYKELCEALKLDSSLKPDKDDVSPKFYALYLKARDEVVHEGTLVCNCEPAGAEVYLSDVLIGETPLRKEHIKEGEYTLTFAKPGYENTKGNVTIKKDVTLTVEDKLAQARGEIKVVSDPEGAAVLLDGKDAGTTPLTVSRVSGGSHKVGLKKDYFDPYVTTVEMPTGGKKEVKTALSRRILFINSGGGAGDRLLEALRRINGMDVIPETVDKLKGVLCARELDPSSLEFLNCKKQELDLEDTAVLSGLLEQEGAELAVAVSEKAGADGGTAVISLYCPRFAMPDVRSLSYKDEKQLKEGLGRFISQWTAQTGGGRAFLGAALVDRAEGGAEALSVVKGLPAALAGIIPGDVIKAVDGRSVAGKDALYALLKTGSARELTVRRGNNAFNLNVVPMAAPTEAPPEDARYLFNLAAVLISGKASADCGETITLGNAYLKAGEYGKALKAYQSVPSGPGSGVCKGTALYRMAQAYEKMDLWAQASDCYRQVIMLSPDATLLSPDGPLAAPLAKARLKELFYSGLVKERWWL